MDEGHKAALPASMERTHLSTLAFGWSAMAPVTRSFECWGSNPSLCTLGHHSSEKRAAGRLHHQWYWYDVHVASVVLEERSKKKGKEILCRCLSYEVWTNIKPLSIREHKHEFKQIYFFKMLRAYHICWVFWKFWWVFWVYGKILLKHAYVCTYMSIHAHISVKLNYLWDAMPYARQWECMLNRGLSTYTNRSNLTKLVSKLI